MMRHVMADHAAISPRGFDTQRDRALLRALWDDLYEDWLAAVAAEVNTLDSAERVGDSPG